jgi:hypothetical protein
MVEECTPYKFMYAAGQPLRVDNTNKIIFINKDVLMKGIVLDIEAGFEWHKIYRQLIMHEKAHELFDKWEYIWCTGSMEFGGYQTSYKTL